MIHAMALGMPGMQELLIVLGIVMLLFGGTRLPQLAKGLGASIREFKRGAAGLEEAAGLGEPPERRLE
jgi:sec-independent protein translocase protein TatA